MRLLDQYQENRNDRIFVLPGKGISQTFISQKPNLAGIRIYLSNSNLGGSGRYLLTVEEADGILRQEEVSESNIGWDMLFRFDFEPIKNSAGKTYTIKLLSLEKEESENLAVYYNSDDAYPYGEMFSDGKTVAGDIVFETYYEATALSALTNSLNQSFFRLKRDSSFFLIYVILLFFILGLSIYALYRKNWYNSKDTSGRSLPVK